MANALAPITSLCLSSWPAPDPANLLSAWSLSPVVLIPLLATALIYVRGLRQRSRQEAAAFAAGWVLLIVALVSPLCRAAAALASAHMVQHVILVALAAPLLVLGGVGRGSLPAVLTRPVMASAIYAAAIWLSHLRPIYEAALTNPALHIVVTVAVLAAAIVFWTALIEAAESGLGIMVALGAMLQTGILGALLTFAPRPWYPVFGANPLIWGVTPIEDQQLAGLVMWIPMGAIYLAAALAILGRMLGGERVAPR